jgi:hypothetical protein
MAASPARDLLTEGSCVIATDWPGRGRVLRTRITLGGDVVVAVSPGFAASPDGAAIALHDERVRAALDGVRRVHRRIAFGAWVAAGAPLVLAPAFTTGIGTQAIEAALPSYAWSAAGVLLGAPFMRQARALWLRLAWLFVRRRIGAKLSGG